MFNSKWQMNRIGLIDFWYYDEQEFYLKDGRMLLRGSNGSGKSVTMQSFIPLLLDGNMRPERLDPFGSRARKMENYLLEEGDEREERTGYLYMEFKRLDGGNYLTIGIGLRARKNKKLETWYFYINDGRRIGKDLNLYKEMANKITYTKQELKNRIGEGGRVMESQNDYMEAMNQLIFGFETIEQYKELLDLLIQLRTPKLSKDFKPTVINDILSSALRTLSEDDLRPMSEAIENMDALKTNLDTLKSGVSAGKQIEKVYDNYNQIMLYEKANKLNDAVDNQKNCDKQAVAYGKEILLFEENIANQEALYIDLQQEEDVLRAEKQSLQTSDAAKLKEQEMSLNEELDRNREKIGKKKNLEAAKEAKERDILQGIKQQAAENDQQLSMVQAYMDEMEEQLGEIPFDEFGFMKRELSNQWANAYDFSSHQKLLGGYIRKVEDGIDILRQEKMVQKHYDEQLEKVDHCRAQRDKHEREAGQYRNQLQEIKEELVESVYSWHKSNQELQLSPEILQQLTRLIQDFEAPKSNYSNVENVLHAQWLNGDDGFHKLSRAAKDQHEEAQGMLLEKEQELSKWQAQKDPEPPQPEAVQKNRMLLAEKGIPFDQFYKMVDFERHLTKEQTSRLEEALFAMGILDALIIPAEYRQEVLKLDKGVSDHYIFSDVATVQQNIMAMLVVDNQGQDIFQEQTVATILGAIGYEDGGSSWDTFNSQGSTWIDGDGHYGLGIIEGTVTQVYEARYIGVHAREAYRQKMLEQLQAEYDQLVLLEAEEAVKVELLQRRRDTLKAEKGNFPKGVDLSLAAEEYGQAIADLEVAGRNLVESQGKLAKEDQALLEVKQQVQAICRKTDLPIRLDVFQEAKESLNDYRTTLSELRAAHPHYLDGLNKIKYFEENLADNAAGLDDIRYDLGLYERGYDEKKKRLASIKEQLGLTDYEAIEERLEHCLKRLMEIPTQRERAVGDKAASQAKLEHTKQELVKNKEKGQLAMERVKLFTEIFAKEYRLGYVERNFVVNDDMADQAKKVTQMLMSSCGNKKAGDVSNNVQAAFHQYRGYLMEYGLEMGDLFADLAQNEMLKDVESIKRIEVTAKYRGVKMAFKELLSELEKEMTQQAHLLSDKDRELFEDILANTISKKIRSRINKSNEWVAQMNKLMESMETSSGLKLSLKWKSKRAEQEEQMDTKTLVAMLQKDVEIMREEEVESLSKHFRSKIEEARKLANDSDSAQSFHSIMREVLDYRKWFEFQLEYQKTGENKKELTDRAFFTFSGGEKAMAMYVPLFSAVVAKYAGARDDAPRIISLDEAFAGVDDMNVKDMFRLMVNFEFNFIINSQILWGDYETVPTLAIYQLNRPENARYVGVISYLWNGAVRILADKMGD